MLLLLLCAGIGIWFYHAKQAATPHTRNLFAMDTFFVLEAYGAHADTGLQECTERIAELEKLLSVTREGSDLWNINHAGGAEVSVSEDTLALILFALEMGEQTGGALEITLYPVLREWGFTVNADIGMGEAPDTETALPKEGLPEDAGDFQVPSRERLQELLKLVDFRQVAVDSPRRTVCVPVDVQLDLGAVAKGYTGDCLVEILRDAGVASGLLNLGGNVHALGKKPDGSLWRVGITDPFDVQKELGVLEVADKAVVTSGSYERYFEDKEGNRYGHILDARNGCPADNGLVSVTVVGERGALCDALSTALFVMGKEDAVTYWREHGNFEMALVTEEGELYLTEGLEEGFQAAEGFVPRIIYGK